MAAALAAERPSAASGRWQRSSIPMRPPQSSPESGAAVPRGVRIDHAWGQSSPSRSHGKASDQLDGDDEPTGEQDHERGQPQAQALFDLGADHIAIAIEHNRNDEKTTTPGDDRAQDEEPDIVAGEARGDGDELVGDRRQPLQQDDNAAPLGMGGAKGFDLVAVMIKMNETIPDRG